ncbi:MAG: phenylacetate-CoA ligase [Verrucomicrobiales bacterium]|jgi:phenylacetate-CoA ligase
MNFTLSTHTSDKSIRANWDSTDPERLREWQGGKLRRYLKETVLPFSAHYGKLGIEPDEIRTLDDLQHLPFTSKNDLLPTEENPKRARDFVLIPDEAVLRRRPSTIAKAIVMGRDRVKAAFEREFRPILLTSTTGRSTESIPFLFSQHDVRNLTIAGRRMMEIGKSKPDYKHLNLFPFAPHLAFWLTHYAGTGFNVFNLSTGGGKVMGTVGNVALMGKIQPDVVIGMPTFIYHVLQEAVCEKLRWSNLRTIVLGGEKVPEGMRRKLRALAGEIGSEEVEIISTYGFTEAKMAWPECAVAPGEPLTGYHLSPDLGIVEVVDPETGKSVGEGHPGEIVFTPLDARGTVVLRYRTGDEISGGLVHETCPNCGRRVPRLLGRISRVSDVRRLKLDKLKGTLVNFNELEHVLDDIDDVGAWQIEIRKRNDDPLDVDELIVHAHDTGSNREQLLARIQDRFQVSAEIRPNRIEFHDAAKMRRKHGVGEQLKEEKIVDHRPK